MGHIKVITEFWNDNNAHIMIHDTHKVLFKTMLRERVRITDEVLVIVRLTNMYVLAVLAFIIASSYKHPFQ